MRIVFLLNRISHQSSRTRLPLKTIALVVWLGLHLTGCSGGGGGGASAGASSASGQTYSLDATVKDLSSSGLVLAVNSASVPVTSGATDVTLASGLASGSSYTVGVETQPTGEVCSVASGAGTIASANAANVVVTCSDQAFPLGGTISGLDEAGLVLANGADTLTVNSGCNGFTMPTAVAYTSSYSVTVQAQPAGLACSVTNGSGTMSAAAVTNVAIDCSALPFTVGGTVTGLGNNNGLVLANGSDVLAEPAGATHFTMPVQIAFGTAYNVSVQSSPAGLLCSVANGSGTMGASNVTNVAVTCSDRSFTVGGTITGLIQAGLVLTNGSDTLRIAANATNFTMPTQVAYTGNYNVQVQSSPPDETCSVSSGSGTMPANPVTGVTVTCSGNAFTVGGTVSGLTGTGLVLLDNGNDPTAISANATQFTMHTGIAYGSTYGVTVGTQPYGITLACTPSNGSGTISGNVTTVGVNCGTVTPIQKELAGYFFRPLSVAVDAHGNLFVADQNNSAVKKVPFNGASYGEPVTLGSGFSYPSAVAVDASDNVFVADTNNNAVKEIPFNGSSYGMPVTIASEFTNPFEVAVDSADDLFVADIADHVVWEIPYSGGSYGIPVTIAAGLDFPRGLAVDAARNVYVGDDGGGNVVQIPYSGGSYGPWATIASGFNGTTGVAVDASGNVFVDDTNNNAVRKIPYHSGSFGAPMTVATGFNGPWGVAVDAGDNVFVGDTGNNAVKEVPYNGGNYGSPVALGVGFSNPDGVTVDTAGDVFVADTQNNAVKEIPYDGGSFGPAVTIGSGFNSPSGVALDAAGDVLVVDTGNNAVKEITFSGGAYNTTITVASGLNGPRGLMVDASGDVFVADTGNNAVKEIPNSGGSFGAPITMGSGFSSPYGVAVDALGDVFVADYSNNAVKELPKTGGSYGAPVALGSGFHNPADVAVDTRGRLYVIDTSNLWMFVP